MPNSKRGLRVGVTGGLGSGKSTVAAMLQAKGAHVLAADEIARGLMQPGTAVYDAIVHRFGSSILCPDGSLDRPALARLAFTDGRAEELNDIVHPATIALQTQQMHALFARVPAALVVVESALIFETRHSEGWRTRFDRMVLVTAPDWLKIERFLRRSGSGDPTELRAEARRRLGQLIPDEAKARQCDYILPNQGTLAQLQEEVDRLYNILAREIQLRAHA
jgi:dephospho-CoA kinase